MTRRLALLLALAGGLLLTGSCAYHGDTGNPIGRNLTWFSYLNGDDIRQQCRVGAPDRYRFVYNGIYTEQVRSYDLTTDGAGQNPVLQIQVLGRRGQVGTITVDSVSGVLSPWSGQAETVHLREVDVLKLQDAMQAGGVFQPLANRLELSSDAFYWIVTACTRGALHFNAYLWPSPRFDQAAFPGLLFAWDPSGIPVNPPRQADPADIHDARSPSDLRNAQRFNLAAGRDGLIGLAGLF
ncbi:hypothetical protein [Shumkonia mesophila]|uniref:hypothetical protein n=1 Tax=Shumkonia mesophila TaxID=2838854 RepID=UPI002934C08C|nr:hypothetical protein [Shumkonia mesophila]